MKYADRDEILYAKIKEKLDKYPVERPDFADIKCNAIEVMAELDEIAPESIDLEFMNIKLLGEDEERAMQINELLSFEDKLLSDSSLHTASLLPLVHNNQLGIVLGKEEPESDPDNFRTEKGELPELTEKESQALLALDLCSDFKLSVCTLISLQNKEKRIKEIKENLVSNPEECMY
jgi:hypothetical protein